MTLTFEQWKIEIRNNCQAIQSAALDLKWKPSEISKPDIKRLFELVTALDQMYENIKEAKN